MNCLLTLVAFSVGCLALVGLPCLATAAETVMVEEKGVVIDDWFFGVQAVSADGYASPVQFAGVVGAFFSAPTR